MRLFIRKYLFIVTFFLFSIFNKGLLCLLDKVNISLKWDFSSPINFFINIVVVVVEFIFIAYTLLFCIEQREEFRVVRYIGFGLLIIIVLVSIVGILNHYNILN